MDAVQQGWYCVDEAGQLQGPANIEQLKVMLKTGTIKDTTLMWCDGMSEWLALASLPSLHTEVTKQDSTANGDTHASAEPLPADDPLAAFKAAIAAVEANPSEDLASAPAAAGPSTPEELSFEDDDGTMYVWDHALRKYVPQGSEAEAGQPPNQPVSAAPAVDYALEDMTFAVEEEIIPTLAAVQAAEKAEEAAEELKLKRGWKRKAMERAEAEAGGQAPIAADVQPPEAAAAAPDGAAVDAPAAPEAPDGGVAPQTSYERPSKKGKKGKKDAPAQPQEPQAWVDLKVNTSVYVTGVPEDVTVEELAAAFTKCGIIKVDEQGQPRIKIYRDKATGMPKGDALVTYLKEPSVDLACQILDGMQLRASQKSTLTVTKAQFQMRGEAYVPKAKPSKQERKKKLEALEKLLSWGGSDDKLRPEQVTVIMHHMFKPEEFIDDPALAEELEEDIAGECSKLGPVEKVRVFKNRPDGVVSVKFRTEEGAKACVQKMDGRYFAGQQIEVHMWDGVTNYQSKVKETAEEEAARLEAYARLLESGGAAARAQPAVAAAAIAPSTAEPGLAAPAPDPEAAAPAAAADVEMGTAEEAQAGAAEARPEADDPGL